MRALGTGANEHEQRIDMDRDAPALGLAETQDRRARDELVLDDPVERARARDLLVPLGQIARRQEHRPLAPAQRQPLGEIVDRMIDERSEEPTSEIQSLLRISYAVFCLKKKNNTTN